MAQWIRTTEQCDGLAAAGPSGRPLFRFGPGVKLRLRQDRHSTFYQVLYQGRSVFVPRASSVLVAQDEARRSAAAALTARDVIGAYRDRPRSRWVVVIKAFFLLVGVVLMLSGIGLSIGAGLAAIGEGAEISAGFVLGIVGGIMLVVGLSVIRLAVRPVFQFAVAASGIAFILGGIQLLIFAIPFSQMSGVDIEADRARTALPAAGAALIAAGAVMLGFVVRRWIRDPAARDGWPVTARWGAAVYGALLLFLGGAVVAVAAVDAESLTPSLADAAALGAAIPLSLVPGGLLLVGGWSMRGRLGAGPARVPPAFLMLALLGVAVAAGAIAVSRGDSLVWLMAPAHAAAALLPALVLIALVSRGGLGLRPPAAGLTHRQLWLALAIGIALVTLVALILDSVLAEALTMGFLAASDAFQGLGSTSELADVLTDVEPFLSRGQLIVLFVGIVVVLAPIMEEGLKGLGVSLLMPRRPTPSAALMLGVAVGGGFGVFEASLYGLSSLDPAIGTDWWALMLVRAGATSMHALNTGMLALALYQARTGGKLSRAFVLYLAAVGMHALWNGLAVLAGSRLIFSFESLSDRQLAAVAFGVMAPLALLTLAALYILSRWAHEASPKLGGERPDATTAPRASVLQHRLSEAGRL